MKKSINFEIIFIAAGLATIVMIGIAFLKEVALYNPQIF